MCDRAAAAVVKYSSARSPFSCLQPPADGQAGWTYPDVFMFAAPAVLRGTTLTGGQAGGWTVCLVLVASALLAEL